jgi:hypothetical protein
VTTIFPFSSPAANAAAKRVATSGVRLSPTTPRSPETLIIGSDNAAPPCCNRPTS